MRQALIFLALILGLGCVASPPNNCVCTAIYDPVCGTDGITYASACMAGCLNISILHKGGCSIGCADSDGGRNESVKGTMSIYGKNYTDYCKEFASVEEYYCYGNGSKLESIKCSEGYECHDGACALRSEVMSKKCQDSDGKDLYAKGSVNASGTILNDTCADYKTLEEYYCEDGEAKLYMAECPAAYRCDEGACVKSDSSCLDSDWGRDIYKEGKVTVTTMLTSSEFLDKCTDDKTVREYYCSAGTYMAENIECPKGYKCINAACKEDACMDSDDGISIMRQGAVSKGKEFLRDACTGKTSGVEYYCDENNIMNVTFECPSGYACADGRCGS